MACARSVLCVPSSNITGVFVDDCRRSWPLSPTNRLHGELIFLLVGLSRALATRRLEDWLPVAGQHAQCVATAGCLQAHPRRVIKVAKQIEREIGSLFIHDKVQVAGRVVRLNISPCLPMEAAPSAFLAEQKLFCPALKQLSYALTAALSLS